MSLLPGSYRKRSRSQRRLSNEPEESTCASQGAPGATAQPEASPFKSPASARPSKRVKQSQDVTRLDGEMDNHTRHISYTINNIQHVENGNFGTNYGYMFTSHPETSVDYLRLLDSLPKHPDVSGHRDEYLPNSRVHDTQAILTWIDKPAAELVMWIHAPAGLGKTTLARHLNSELRSKGRLGASVFFSTLGDGVTGGPESITKLIGAELGRLHHDAVASIIHAIRACHSAPIQTQLERYIRDTIQSLQLTQPLVIVLDAVDEWHYHEAFVKDLACLNSSSTLVRFVIFSRSDPRVIAFHGLSLRRYQLPPASDEVMQGYINERFNDISWEYGRRPTHKDVAELAKKADGLFIWAAIACSLLADKFKASSPQERLTAILSSRQALGETDGLAKLYYHGIASIFPTPDSIEALKDYLSAVTVLQEPLPIDDFSSLAGLRPSVVETIQANLRTLQVYQPNDADFVVYPACSLFHLSFVEYLQSPSLPPTVAFPVPPPFAHSKLGLACLKELLRDLPTSDLSTLYLSPRLRYAIKHWLLHVAKGTPTVAPSSDSVWKEGPHHLLLQRISITGLNQWARLFLDMMGGSLVDLPRTYGEYEAGILMRDIGKVLDQMLRISCLEVAVRLQPRDADSWCALGRACYDWAQQTIGPEPIDRAITSFQHVVEIGNGCSKPQEDEVELLRTLATCFAIRFQRRGALEDLEDSIIILRRALSSLSSDHPHYPPSLNSLANSLRSRFRHTTSVGDLEEGISKHRQALLHCPSDHPKYPEFLRSLAASLRTRFEHSRCVGDLEEAISLEREELSFYPADHPERSTCLSHIAICLALQFEHTGSEKHLHESITLLRDALALSQGQLRIRLNTLKHLGLALRFSLETQDEALSVVREAASLVTPGYRNRWIYLKAVAIVLLSRYQRSGVKAELEEAICVCRQALDLSPPRYFERPKLLQLEAKLEELKRASFADDIPILRHATGYPVLW
ncbi:hypothetical protein FA13DRAFT_1723866 [Coprinellus micaceus]|uniref:Nephrocystin 3-like N-terminal domain-containing protein n=1 Tax=Coprinellus micaceus TaxID=71717 RepID=A0A4Y7U1C9_COPMI|nr:hypothetical protein FA13DRAFT_1723866 [Coprinellus micaceus]